MFFRSTLFALVSALVVASSHLVLAADGGGSPPDGVDADGIDSESIDVSAPLAAEDAAAVPDVAAAIDLPIGADAPAAIDAAVVADASYALDAFVAVDSSAAGLDAGARASDGGSNDGGTATASPVYLPDGGARGLVADDTACSFGGGRPARGGAFIPLFGLVALWVVRRRGRR